MHRNGAELQGGGGPVLSDLRLLMGPRCAISREVPGHCSGSHLSAEAGHGPKGPSSSLRARQQRRVGLGVAVRRYAEQHNLEVSSECIKGEYPGAGCRHCPPFFFKEPSGERRQTQKREPVSRQMVTDAVIKSLQLVGTDTTYFSGSSMRRGGISAALTAKVPAPVLYLQSGHGGKMAAQNYMIPADPSVWYENFAALQL